MSSNEEELLFGEKPYRIIELDEFKLMIPRKEQEGFNHLFLLSLIHMDHPRVNEVLLKSGVTVSDINGKLFFPKKNMKLSGDVASELKLPPEIIALMEKTAKESKDGSH